MRNSSAVSTRKSVSPLCSDCSWAAAGGNCESERLWVLWEGREAHGSTRGSLTAEQYVSLQTPEKSLITQLQVVKLVVSRFWQKISSRRVWKAAEFNEKVAKLATLSYTCWGDWRGFWALWLVWNIRDAVMGMNLWLCNLLSFPHIHIFHRIFKMCHSWLKPVHMILLSLLLW